MANAPRRPRRRPPLPRSLRIGVGAVLSATGGTVLSVAVSGVLGGGALVTTALAGGAPHSVAPEVVRPAHVQAPVAPPPPAPVAAPANPPVVSPASNPHSGVGGVGGSSEAGSIEISAPASAPAPRVPVTAAPPPPPVANPPVTAAPPPVRPAARVIAVPTTGAGGAAPLTGAALLGSGALLILGSLRRQPPGPRPFDDELPPYF